MKKILITSLIGALGLTACTQSDDLVLTQFHREAGSLVDIGGFGNSTLNNALVQSGERQFVHDLATRFAGEVATNVNFAFNSAQLDDSSRDTLREQAAWIKQFPEVRFRVYGHTDLVGSSGYNRRLGKRRADAVVHYLVSQGINRGRLEAVASFGETQPLIATQNRERRNRRTVTEVSGFIQSHQSVLDGKYAQIIYRDYIRSAEPRSGLDSITGAELATTQ
ncbi:MAG: OmpA family protein [Paracoccaceae bacterium]